MSSLGLKKSDVAPGADAAFGWATPEEMAAFGSGDPTRDLILGQGVSIAYRDAGAVA